MGRKKTAQKKEVKIILPSTGNKNEPPIFLIRTNVQIKREDYIKILELRAIAEQEVSPIEMRRSWGFFHGYIDDLAVNSYRLPKLTGLYGITKDGYFSHSSDAVEVGKIKRPNLDDYMKTPII